MIRVFIVDDHKILAQALFDYLNTKSNLECIGMAHSGQEAIDTVQNQQADVVLMDIGMPGMDGIQCTKELLQIQSDLTIVGLSTHKEVSIVKNLFKAGAMGFVSKNADLREIHTAIEQVHEGKRYIGEVIREAYLSELSADPAAKPLSSSYIPQLTQRELEVLALIAEECTTEEIAEKLFISKNTVQTHRKHLISKFGVRNSVGLVLKALECKLI
ncbi:MAG: response regulator transcription factor [Bacteroidota bacterium]